jgi:hypothetical protein
MLTGVQPKLELNLDFGDLNYRLVRERDRLVKESSNIIWLEWNEDRTFKSKHNEPAIGRSLLMSPFNESYTWQTTVVVEILEQKEDYLKFRTENSIYELRRL